MSNSRDFNLKEFTEKEMRVRERHSYYASLATSWNETIGAWLSILLTIAVPLLYGALLYRNVIFTYKYGAMAMLRKIIAVANTLEIQSALFILLIILPILAYKIAKLKKY